MTPDARGHKPQYGSASYDKVDRHNQLLHLLGGTGAVPAGPNVKEGKCIKLHQVGGAGGAGVGGRGSSGGASVQHRLGGARFARQPRAACLPACLPACCSLTVLPSPPPLPAQDANVFVSESDAGVQHSITLGAGRQVYLTCAEGSLTVGTGETGALPRLRCFPCEELVLRLQVYVETWCWSGSLWHRFP